MFVNYHQLSIKILVKIIRFVINSCSFCLLKHAFFACHNEIMSVLSRYIHLMSLLTFLLSLSEAELFSFTHTHTHILRQVCLPITVTSFQTHEGTTIAVEIQTQSIGENGRRNSEIKEKCGTLVGNYTYCWHNDR